MFYMLKKKEKKQPPYGYGDIMSCCICWWQISSSVINAFLLANLTVVYFMCSLVKYSSWSQMVYLRKKHHTY